VRFAFEKTGMAISIAQDGKEALRQFDRNVHELIVLDIGMPEMDGLEVCRQIRKTSDTPILFLSARDEEIDRILGLEIGGDDYVTKPFSPRELRRQAGRADRARVLDPANAAGAAGIRLHPRIDPRCRLCRQYSRRRPHHRQPRPEHPRQDGGCRLRFRDRDRPWRRLQTGTLRGVALIDAAKPVSVPRQKWRPSLSLVLFIVLASVLLLPLFSLYFLKIYQNQLIQQTESELIAQSAALSAVFGHEVEAGISQAIMLGAKVPP